jgi:thiamine pyrophosphate-dependent acetolactate synthase large subunit-like protein
MKVHDALARAVRAEGCTAVFGLLGDANMPAWVSLAQESGLRLVSARHEAGAVAMADGYSRATGEVGVATLTSGPGLTQTGTSLVCAARNRTPLVVLAGAVPATELDSVQRFDHRRFAQACEAGYAVVTSAANAGREIAESFYLARCRRGPVVLDLPTDVQAQELDWEFDYAGTASRPGAPLEPTARDVKVLVDALLAAKRPVIIAGWGVKLTGAAGAVAQLAECCGALLATTLKSKGLFAGHPWDVGIAGAFASAVTEELLAEADFVLGLGAELGYHTTEGGLLFPEAKVARVDIAAEPAQLGVLPGLYVRGDAKATADALVQEIRKRGDRKHTGFRTAEAAARLNDSRSNSWPSHGDGMDPRALASALGSHLPQDAVVTLGAGHFWSFFLMYSAIPASVDLHCSYAFGAIGQTMPLAVGVATARTARPHLVIEGDGSIMMNLQELETLSRSRLPAVVLVWNDRGFGAEAHKLRAKGWDQDLGRWPVSPDFVTLARAFGGDGAVVERVEDLAAVLARGFAFGGLFVVDARVSSSVVSDPYLKLQYGRENQAPLLRPTKGNA